MFTGIIQGLGRVLEVSCCRLVVHDPQEWPHEPWQLGESVSVDGCCLTLVGYTEPGLAFDLSPETWDRTAFATLRVGRLVNLERAMRLEDRFGGHIVSGHVDGVGLVRAIESKGTSHEFRFHVPENRYLIDKGSITIQGVSLTVVEPLEHEFSAWIVPHTFQATSLGSLAPGDKVNVEYDVLARYVEKLIEPSRLRDGPWAR